MKTEIVLIEFGAHPKLEQRLKKKSCIQQDEMDGPNPPYFSVVKNVKAHTWVKTKITGMQRTEETNIKFPYEKRKLH